MATDQHIFDEILSSDRVGSYLQSAYNLGAQAIPDDPSWIWQQIRWNPWLAMAVYEDLEEKDAMVASTLDTRKDGVMAKSRIVLPSSEKRQDKKLAEFIDETLHDYFDPSVSMMGGTYFGFDNFIYEALDAVGKGVAIGETIFANGRDRVYIKDVKFKPQHLFNFGDGQMAAYSAGTYQYPQTGPLRLRGGIYAEGLPDDGLLPEMKFFVHTYRPRYSNRWGSPLLRKIFWPSWFKRAAVKQWLRYLEKGAGSVVARYNDGAGQDEQTRALDAAEAINQESAVAIPKKFLMEVMEHVRPIGSAHRELVDDFCNSEIARAVLGQTLTSRGSDGGGSRALGGVHNLVRGEKIEADSKSLMVAVNTRLVWPLTLLNQGPVERPPTWVIKYDPQQDLSATSTWLARLWTMKLPLSKSKIYNTFQMAAPDDEADTLPPPDGEAKPSIPERGVDSAAFAENKKKTQANGFNGRLKPLPGLKMERFEKLRPSTMPRLKV